MSIITFPNDNANYYTPNFAAFDTFCLRRAYPASAKITTRRLKWVGKNTRVFDDGVLNVKHQRITDQNGNLLYQTVTVLCHSLPALLYGSNVFAAGGADEIDEALDLITERASNLLAFRFDAHAAKVSAADIHRDFFTRDAFKYLSAVKNHEVARTKRENIFETVQFVTKERCLQLYSKENQINKTHSDLSEMVRSFANNIIRLETGASGKSLKRDIKAYHGSATSAAGNILTPDFASFIAKRSLSSFGLDADIPTFADYTNHLTAKAKKASGRAQTTARLINFMSEINEKGVAAVRKTDERLFKHRRAQLAKLGCWRTYFADKTLPGLADLANDDISIYANSH